MKKVGFWLEEGYSARSSIYVHLNKEITTKRKIPYFLSFYLGNSPRLTISMGWEESIIDRTKISSSTIRTDGVWVWNDSLVYYYENHGLVLPKEFVTHIKRRLIPYPILFGLKLIVTIGTIKGHIYKKITKEFLEEEANALPH